MPVETVGVELIGHRPCGADRGRQLRVGDVGAVARIVVALERLRARIVVQRDRRPVGGDLGRGGARRIVLDSAGDVRHDHEVGARPERHRDLREGDAAPLADVVERAAARLAFRVEENRRASRQHHPGAAAVEQDAATLRRERAERRVGGHRRRPTRRDRGQRYRAAEGRVADRGGVARPAVDGDALEVTREEIRRRVVGEVVAVAERDAVEGDVVLPVGEPADRHRLRFAEAGPVRGDIDHGRREADRIVVVAGGRDEAVERNPVDGRGRLGFVGRLRRRRQGADIARTGQADHDRRHRDRCGGARDVGGTTATVVRRGSPSPNGRQREQPGGHGDGNGREARHRGAVARPT